MDKIVGRHIRKHINEAHAIKRMENFFILALGEGVFLLVRGSPLGQGLSAQLARGVLGLLIYYALHSLYFNSDQSKKYVHPVYRQWWRRELYYL